MRMKKIYVDINDKVYKNKLIKNINMLYGNVLNLIDISMMDSDEFDEYVITDNINSTRKNCIYISDSADSKAIFKYQSVDKIYSKIIKTISKSKHSESTKLVLLANLNFITMSNKSNIDISKSLSKEYKTLIINFNEFMNYGKEEKSRGLEDLLIYEKVGGNIDIGDFANESSEFDYINSCEFPLKLEALNNDNIDNVITSLRKSEYNFALIEKNLFLDKFDLHLLSQVDKIVLYFNSDIDIDYVEKELAFLRERYDLVKKAIIIDLGNSVSNIQGCYHLTDEAEFIEKVSEFVRSK